MATGQDGKYYILVGSVYDNQNKDNPFKVELISQTDANTDHDAGDTDATALEIMQGTYDKNFLSANDVLDTYKINLPVGSYELKIRSQLQNVMMTATLVDADGVEIASGRSPNEGAAPTIPFFTKKPGYVFIRVKEPYSSGQDVPYSLSIGPGSGTPPTSDQTSTVPPAQSPSANSVLAGLPSKVGTSDEVVTVVSKGFSNLGFLQKTKFAFVYIIGPAFGIFLIGLL